jgi:Peptidase A4 family
MQTHNKFAKLAIFVVLGSLLVTLATLATAQSDVVGPIRASAATVPTNVLGIRTYAKPPKDFNPLMATDAELAVYGFPQRPDTQAHPDQYAEWERAMKAAKTRWSGDLKPLPGGEHGMIPSGSLPLPEAAQQQTSGPKHISTKNASGVIVSSGQKTFTKNSVDGVVATIVVPQVRMPFDTISCTGNGFEVFSSVGIDGFVFNTGNGHGFYPQLQAGVFEQASCSGELYYFAVIGWEGDYFVAFDVNPGDIVYAVASTEGGTNSSVYLEDYTISTSASYAVTTRGIIGATADWTVQRLCCSDNELIPLANTVNIGFGRAFAGKGVVQQFFWPGSQASSTQVLTMTDDAGDQSIEEVTQGSSGSEGLAGLWFETFNCAYSGGCTP